MTNRNSLFQTCVALLLSAVLLLAFGAWAEESSPLAVGDELCGFKVMQIVHNQQYDVDCVHMEHEKTGAQLIYIPCEDTERSFTVSFRTPAENDKGIPHVYEHSTLSGSEKYPDPSLFFAMMNQTYNTYLNAATYISNTTFDAASLSEEQLLAYADYIVSGLYHPLIMTDERAMMREAYRYELADEDAPLTLNGTVYSEMRAYTGLSESANAYSMKQLFPGSRFAAFNGGAPDVIPEMSWQELKDFHDKYYHPSNSLTILYGKLDPVPFLELIDAEISSFERAEIVLTDENYTPLSGNVEEKRTVPVSADSASEAYIYYGIPMEGLSTHEMDVLQLYSSMYVVDGSPIFRLFAEQMPGVTVNLNLMTNTPVPLLHFQVIGATEDQAEQVKALLCEGLAQTAEQGVDGDMMKAAATSFKLQGIQTRENNNKGVALAAQIATLWGPQGDLMAYTENDRRIAQVVELADAEALRGVAERFLVNPQNSGFGVYVSEPGALEEKQAAEEAHLVQMKADMSAEERAALIARTRDFYAWTEENAANSMIDSVKVVDAQSLPEELVSYTAEDSVQDGVRIIRSDVDCDDLVNVQLVFRADHIPYEKYDVFENYIQLLGGLGTKNYTADALQTAAMEISTGIAIERSSMDIADGGVTPVVIVSWDCLPENLDACYDLVRELIWNTDTTDLTHARSTIANVNQATAIYSVMDPSQVLVNLILGYANAAGRFDALSAVGERFDWYMNRSNWSDEELSAALEEGKAMLLEGMRRENLIVCAVSSRENNDRAIAAGLRFAAELNDEPGMHYDYTGVMEQLPESIALPMDIDVGYNGVILPYAGSGIEKTGQMSVFTSLVQDKLLFPELRFKNGSYGAVFMAGRTGIVMYSYRDPKLAESYAFYDSLADRLRALELTQEDVDGYIVSEFSSLSMPMGPLSGGEMAVSDRLNGLDSFADNLRYMHEVKQTTPEDIYAMAELIDQMMEKGANVCVHNQKLVAENSALFAVIDDTYMFAGAAEDVEDAA